MVFFIISPWEAIYIYDMIELTIENVNRFPNWLQLLKYLRAIGSIQKIKRTF